MEHGPGASDVWTPSPLDARAIERGRIAFTPLRCLPSLLPTERAARHPGAFADDAVRVSMPVTPVRTNKWPSRGITEIRRMWKDGPLCWWSESETQPQDGKRWVSYCPKDKVEGWVGSYVCDECQRDAAGVYLIAKGWWICGTCRYAAKSTKVSRQVVREWTDRYALHTNSRGSGARR